MNVNNKILITFVIALIAIPILYSGVIFAKNSNDSEDSVLPEQDGIYDVQGHPGLKLRVIVHHEKPIRAESSLLVCNLSDPDSSTVVTQADWKLPSGTWVYTLNTGSVPLSVGGLNLATMASDAFGRWSGATGSSNKVLFSQSPLTTSVNRARMDGKNIIAWGRTQGTALAVTYTWYYPSTGLAVETDTIMNNKFSWSWSNPATWTGGTTCANSNTYDAQNILTHELGHWMGLDDMYNAATYQNATMYGYGSKTETKKDTLSAGDVAGVIAIYPN